jgi:hypothetical protein
VSLQSAAKRCIATQPRRNPNQACGLTRDAKTHAAGRIGE